MKNNESPIAGHEAQGDQTVNENATDGRKKVLLYRDRSWSEVESPILDAVINDWDENLYENGWLLEANLGDVDSIGVDLYHRRFDAPPCQYRWLAAYNTADICQTIVIARFQDLIDFLAHVSSTMLAVVLPSDTGMILHELFEKTSHRIEERKRQNEDWRRAQREKREKQQQLIDCNAFLCLPEDNPSHYVDGKHLPIKDTATAKKSMR